MIDVRKIFEKFRVFFYNNLKFRIILLFFTIFFLILKIFENFEILLEIIIVFLVYLISMIFHEIAHGYVAYRFGDDTAKKMGRITINPLKHIDLFGIIFPIIVFLSGFKFLIGWAKPVPVNFSKLFPQKKGIFCVCIAGVTVNFIFSIISFVFLKIFGKYFENNIILEIFICFYLINLLLGIFNLIPILPFDGGRIVYLFSGKKLRKFYDNIEKYGIVIIIVIVYFCGEYLSSWILEMFNFFMKIAGIDF